MCLSLVVFVADFRRTGLSLAVEIRPLPASGDFWDFSSKIVKNGSFYYWSMGVLSVVAEIRPLPFWGNFRDFTSKIIKNRPFYHWSDGSIVYRDRDTTTSVLG
jgi:hypothetical protein